MQEFDSPPLFGRKKGQPREAAKKTQQPRMQNEKNKMKGQPREAKHHCSCNYSAPKKYFFAPSSKHNGAQKSKKVKK